MKEEKKMVSKKTKNKTELRIKKFGLQLPRIFFLHKAKTLFFSTIDYGHPHKNLVVGHGVDHKMASFRPKE